MGKTKVYDDYPRPYVERELAAERELLWSNRQPFESIADAPKHMDHIRARFDYDPASGKVLWRQKNPDQADRIATKVRGGVSRVSFDGFLVAAAKIVWLLHYGEWFEGKLGRRDGDLINDRIENLYDKSQELADALAAIPRRAPSRGVARLGPDHWQAYCKVDGKQKNLGRFKTEQAAKDARAAWDAGVDLV